MSTEDTVFLTGGTGFIGSHILDALVAEGYAVRALVRPGSRRPTFSTSVTVVTGDVRQSGYLVADLRGCRYLVHAAALYSFAPRDRKMLWETNVHGTKSLLEAARIAGVERVVMTSSSATVGPMRDGRAATEEDWALTHTQSGYHDSKIQQEREALRAQIPTVLLLPTAPVGSRDWKPTPTGKMIVDFMKGRIFASLPGGINIVAVEDVARAHLLALTRGKPAERYLVGGANLKLTDLWAWLAEICGRNAPKREVPYLAALALGMVDHLRCRLFPAESPLIPLEGVRMGRELMFVESTKAERDLGYRPRSVSEALAEAVDWFRANGYAK